MLKKEKSQLNNRIKMICEYYKNECNGKHIYFKIILLLLTVNFLLNLIIIIKLFFLKM
jgi:hypothetical protein